MAPLLSSVPRQHRILKSHVFASLKQPRTDNVIVGASFLVSKVLKVFKVLSLLFPSVEIKAAAGIFHPTIYLAQLSDSPGHRSSVSLRASHAGYGSTLP